MKQFQQSEVKSIKVKVSVLFRIYLNVLVKLFGHEIQIKWRGRTFAMPPLRLLCHTGKRGTQRDLKLSTKLFFHQP